MSEALHRPNGSLLNQNVKYPAKKFVRCLQSWCSTWKKALNRSIVENHEAPFNSDKIASNVGIRNGVLMILLLGPLRSTTKRMSFLPFGTTNKDEQNEFSILSVTRSMMPVVRRSSNLFNVSFLNAGGILVNTFRVGGISLSYDNITGATLNFGNSVKSVNTKISPGINRIVLHPEYDLTGTFMPSCKTLYRNAVFLLNNAFSFGTT